MDVESSMSFELKYYYPTFTLKTMTNFFVDPLLTMLLRFTPEFANKENCEADFSMGLWPRLNGITRIHHLADPGYCYISTSYMYLLLF